MTGEGTAQGAGTIVNAFATGRGVAFGVRAKVVARVSSARAWSVWNGRRRLPAAEARLVRQTAGLVQESLQVQEPLRIQVESDLPAMKGLKSSSAVSLAVAQAVLHHHQRKLTERGLLSLVGEAGLKSKTSLTGAYDDAAACLVGGVVFVDNEKRRILERDQLPGNLIALIHIPKRTIATGRLDRKRFLPVHDAIEEAWKLAAAGRYKDAMIVNTLAYTPLLGLTPKFTLQALEMGAYAAGLSGKGPAEIALVHKEETRRFRPLERGGQWRELYRGGEP